MTLTPTLVRTPALTLTNDPSPSPSPNPSPKPSPNQAAFARASVSGLTLAALSVTLLVRLGPAAPQWITLWSFDALGGGLRCEVSDTGDAEL